MELTSKHRSALIDALLVSKDKLKSFERALNNPSKDNADLDLNPLWEIDIFLEKERIILIQQSIVDNNIDY